MQLYFTSDRACIHSDLLSDMINAVRTSSTLCLSCKCRILSFLPPQSNNFYALVSLCFPAETISMQTFLMNINLHASFSSLFFTPTRNQTVLCPDPPCDPSTTTPACCCKGPTRSGRSGWAERGAAAPEVRWNTGPFPAQSAPPWAAALWGLWETRAELERRGHSLQPSNLCRSCWNYFEAPSYSEATRHGSGFQRSVSLKPRGRSHAEMCRSVRNHRAGKFGEIIGAN